MKKLSFILVIGAIAFTSCSKAPKASLKTGVDSLSYALGVANTDGLKQYLATQFEMDTTKMNAFVKGLVDGASKDKAYLEGIRLGQQFSEQIQQTNETGFMGDSDVKLNKDNFFAGFISGTEGKAKITAEEAKELIKVKVAVIQEEVAKKQEEELNKTYGANKAAGIAFLAENAKKAGVIVLPSGLQYKVLKAGKGAKPTATDVVKVHYHGTLIDGTVFDSSVDRGQAATFGVTQVIAGWTEALQLMPIGSKWMLYIPYDLAYSSQDRGTIKPFSALVFEIELLGIEK